MLMDLAMVGNMEGLLDLVPDSVVEKAVERKQQMRWRLKTCAALGYLAIWPCNVLFIVSHVHKQTKILVPPQPLCQNGEG